MIISVLGTNYEITFKSEEEDEKLKTLDGYCDFSTKKIICVKDRKNDVLDLENLNFVKNRILRHEILHAFMYESGLWCNSFGVSSWADNEEMTDWFAIQSPKIYEVYKKLKILN